MSYDTEIHAHLNNSDKFYNIRQVIRGLGSDISLALPFFYAFTRCDTVSSFYGKNKCKAYDVWIKSEQKDDLTVFIQLGEKPTNVTSDQIDMLESFVLQLYGSTYDKLGATRLDKFNKSTDNDFHSLPPSKEALRQHIYRASYQAGYLWRQSVEELDIPNPEQWGWKADSTGDFEPLWLTSKSSVTVKDFIQTCSCKTEKCNGCKCACANAECLSMCGCGRGCI